MATAANEVAHGTDDVPVVLVVDDERTNRMVLGAVLTKEGYEVIDAETGEEAVKRFEESRPDLVLMDIMMPGMDGYEATRRIKALSGERFTPVIFLTALTDENALARCIEAGGDDFLTKPYNRVILRAKMDSMMRLRRLYGVLSDHREQLGRHNDRLEREQAIAERVFANILKPESLEGLGIRYLLAPVGNANGDVVMAERRPDGGCNYMIGDFTGHGLAAAVGALPASELFRGMARDNADIGAVAAALNEQLKSVLPTGLFLAACLVGREPDGTFQVWNGGIPDALFCAPDGGLVRVASTHLPLGVIEPSAFDGSVETVEPGPGTRLYLYSDGAVDAHDAQGARFGQERLEEALHAAGHEQRFEALTGQLDRFRHGAVQQDDITVVEIDCDAIDPNASTAETPLWRIEMHVEAAAIGRCDPVEPLVEAVGSQLDPNMPRERLHMILGELYNNAVDYGLLGLDGADKRTPEGFERYFEERTHLLRDLRRGRVAIRISCFIGDDGRRRLRLRMEDSGRGFDFGCLPPELDENLGLSGRGIRVVRALCDSMEFLGRGNVVEVVCTIDDV